MDTFRGEKIWRWLTNFWTLVYFFLLFAGAFYPGRFDLLMVPLTFLYLGILGIYVGTKEFDRWYDLHGGKRHPGELFVAVWTAVIILLFAISVYSSVYFDRKYKLSDEAVATYIAVLSIFALTRRSKALHREAVRRKAEL